VSVSASARKETYKQKPGFEAVVKIEAAVEGILEIKAVVEVEAVMCRRRYQGRGRTQERALVRRSASAQDCCRGCYRGIEAAVKILGRREVLRPPSKCLRLLSRREAAVEVSRLSDCRS
jgi:hypothetical protein